MCPTLCYILESSKEKNRLSLMYYKVVRHRKKLEIFRDQNTTTLFPSHYIESHMCCGNLEDIEV